MSSSRDLFDRLSKSLNEIKNKCEEVQGRCSFIQSVAGLDATSSFDLNIRKLFNNLETLQSDINRKLITMGSLIMKIDVLELDTDSQCKFIEISAQYTSFAATNQVMINHINQLKSKFQINPLAVQFYTGNVMSYTQFLQCTQKTVSQNDVSAGIGNQFKF